MSSRGRAATRKRSRQPDMGPSTPELSREPHTSPRPPEALSAARLLTAAQLAERWQVPKAHVYRLSREYGLPTVRLGRYFRYRLDAIERWEEAQANA